MQYAGRDLGYSIINKVLKGPIDPMSAKKFNQNQRSRMSFSAKRGSYRKVWLDKNCRS